MNDPDTHGHDVAALAKRILSGEKVEEIPIVPKPRYEPAFDYRQMQRFGVRLDQIPVHSSFLGRPASLYSLNKALVWGLAVVIAGLLMSTLFLLGHLRHRRLLHGRDELIHAAFDNALGAIVIVDFAGRVLRVNPTAGQLLGYSREHLERLILNDFTHEEDWSRVGELLGQMKAGPSRTSADSASWARWPPASPMKSTSRSPPSATMPMPAG